MVVLFIVFMKSSLGIERFLGLPTSAVFGIINVGHRAIIRVMV